jgi:acyl carrier protein
MPSVTEVRETLGEMAARLGYTGPLEARLRLIEDLRLDSLGRLTLAVEVEDHFRLCLSADDEAAILTVGDLERVIVAKLEGAPVGHEANEPADGPA